MEDPAETAGGASGTEVSLHRHSHRHRSHHDHGPSHEPHRPHRSHHSHHHDHHDRHHHSHHHHHHHHDRYSPSHRSHRDADRRLELRDSRHRSRHSREDARKDARERRPEGKDKRHSTALVVQKHKDYGGPGDAQKDSIYLVDKRGDPLIWQFGSLDRARIPAYHRLGGGRFVLGSQQRFSFGYEGSKELFSQAQPFGGRGSVFGDKNNPLLRAAMARLTGASSRGAGSKNPTGAGAGAGAGAGGSAADDFVPLRTSRKGKRSRSRAGSDRSSDKDNSSDSGSSSESEAESDFELDFSTGDTNYEAAKKEFADLSRRVRESPQDVDAWLALVHLQDQQHRLLGNEADFVFPNSQQNDRYGGRDVDAKAEAEAEAEAARRDEAVGIARAKLAILESALRQVAAPEGRERLHLALMREGAKVWSPKQLAQRWAKLAGRGDGSASSSQQQRQRPLSFALWRAQLDFEQTNLSSFTVDRIKGFLVERLRALEGVAAGQESGSAAQAETYAQMVYVFLRATRCLFDAGFADLATAAWTALLESVFERPPRPEASLLADFWDSEVPRLGEDRARGWRYFVEHGEDTEDTGQQQQQQEQRKKPLPTVDAAAMADSMRRARGSGVVGGAEESEADADDEALDKQRQMDEMDEFRPLYEAWAAAETQRAQCAKLPARVLDDNAGVDVDDDGYEDLFRVVVFSDIEPLLFSLPDAQLPLLCPLLVDAFLLFCQLPPASGASPWIQAARDDSFLAAVYVPTDVPAYADVGGATQTLDAGRLPPDLACDGSRVAVSLELLLGQPDWFRYLPDWLGPGRDTDAPSEPPVPPRWIANTLRRLAALQPWPALLPELAPYSLAVDVAVNPAGVKKAGRAAVRRDMTNTALYVAYALAEQSCGHAREACAVLQAASLALQSTMTVPDSLLLRQAWAWLELEAGRRDEAVLRLLSGDHEGGDNAPLSPARVLMARQALRAGMDYGLSAGRVDEAALHAQAFVLLAYLDTAGSPSPEAALRTSPRQGHLAAMLSASTAFSQEMQARGHGQTPAHECFLQWTARILYWHARKGPYRPADLQAPLGRFVELFPHNGIFLRLFAWVDPASASGLSRLRPDDPVRQILERVLLDASASAPAPAPVWAFAVRQALAAGHVNAARAVLERALSAPSAACKGSAQLWRALVRLTAAQAFGEEEASVSASFRKRRRVDKKMAVVAKDTFYRAVQACPWSRDLFLEAFWCGSGVRGRGKGHASAYDGMAPVELRAVFDTMLGKGLRVHIDLNAVRERARRAVEGGSSTGLA